MKRISFLFVLFVAAAAVASADDSGKLMLFGDYNVPINPPADETSSSSARNVPPAAAESISFGAAYRFWEIFFVGGHSYNEIIYGADNALNIRAIRPLGLFSLGLGIEIPLGGVGLLFDWQRVFTGAGAEEGIFDFSNSFKWGLTFEVSERFALEAYARKFSNFTSRTKAEYELYSDDPNFNTFGAGAVLRLF